MLGSQFEIMFFCARVVHFFTNLNFDEVTCFILIINDSPNSELFDLQLEITFTTYYIVDFSGKCLSCSTFFRNFSYE